MMRSPSFSLSSLSRTTTNLPSAKSCKAASMESKPGNGFSRALWLPSGKARRSALSLTSAEGFTSVLSIKMAASMHTLRFWAPWLQSLALCELSKGWYFAMRQSSASGKRLQCTTSVAVLLSRKYIFAIGKRTLSCILTQCCQNTVSNGCELFILTNDYQNVWLPAAIARKTFAPQWIKDLWHFLLFGRRKLKSRWAKNKL